METGTSTMRGDAWLGGLPMVSLITIALLGLAGHGVLLVTDHVIWDGWWQFADVARTEGPVVTMRHLHEVGRPLDSIYYRPFCLLTDFDSRVAASKAAGLACWILTAIAMFVVLRRGAAMPAPQATVVAALAMLLPTFPLLGEYCLWMYTAAVLLFWLSWALLTVTAGYRGGVRIFARILSCVMFFLSFNLNSLLVMFYGVAAMLAGMSQRLDRRRWLTGNSALLLAHADLLAMPIVFWIWKNVFTPPNGPYAGYNRPSLDPVRIVGGYAGVIRDVLIGGCLELVSSPLWVFLGVAAAVATSLVLGRHAAAAQRLLGDTKAADGSRMLAWGLVLLLAAAFPYIVVGQSLAASGWQSRNSILCPLPLALITTGLLIWANSRFLPARSHAWLPAACCLLILSIGCLGREYLALQGFGAKQWSLLARLQDPARGQASVVQFRDYWRLPGTIAYYPPVIWTFLAAHGRQSPETFVFETASRHPDLRQVDASGRVSTAVPRIEVNRSMLDGMIKETTLGYALEAIPRDGRHLLLMVMPTNQAETPLALGLRYLRQKWLRPDGLAEFLRGLTSEHAVDLGRVAAE